MGQRVWGVSLVQATVRDSHGDGRVPAKGDDDAVATSETPDDAVVLVDVCDGEPRGAQQAGAKAVPVSSRHMLDRVVAVSASAGLALEMGHHAVPAAPGSRFFNLSRLGYSRQLSRYDGVMVSKRTGVPAGWQSVATTIPRGLHPATCAPHPTATIRKESGQAAVLRRSRPSRYSWRPRREIGRELNPQQAD